MRVCACCGSGAAVGSGSADAYIGRATVAKRQPVTVMTVSFPTGFLMRFTFQVGRPLG